MKQTILNRFIPRTAGKRLMVALLLGAMLACLFTSCMPNATANSTLSGNDVVYVEGTNALPEADLIKLADKIDEHKSDAAIREQLVAALNGYDMTAADFNDDKLPEANKEKTPQYAVNVLKKFEIDTEMCYKKVTDAEGKESTVLLLNTADVQSIVDSFKTTVNVDAKLNLLDTVLHYVGIGFGFLIRPLGFGSFILGTVYFAIILELLMLPIGINQQKNSRKQARLRPKEVAIRNKYKGRNDQATMQKLNQEIQELYSKEGYSPMSGCLPMLVSLPVLMALYYVVIDPLKYIVGAPTDLSNAFITFATAAKAAGGLGIELTQAGRGTIEALAYVQEMGAEGAQAALNTLGSFQFFDNSGEILAKLNELKILENIPDFGLFGLNMGLVPDPVAIFKAGIPKNYILLLMPVLTFLVYWGSGKITRKFTFQPMQQTDGQKDPAQGCSNGMMNIMMPAMSAYFTVMVPAAVGLYWLFKSVISTVKTIILAKIMPLPVFTEEDYKAAERELAGKDKNRPVKKSGTPNPNVRSLHHIDDEDYESPAEREARLAARKAEYVEPDEPEKPKVAEGKLGDGATIKEDRPEGEPFSFFKKKDKKEKKDKKDKKGKQDQTVEKTDGQE